jgi:molybdopterin converting factor small subunit
MAKIIIPTPLRGYTDNQKSVEVKGDTVENAIQNLTEAFPALKNNLLEDDGNIREFVKIYLEDEDINGLDKERTPLKTDSVLSIVPAIAGGSC